VPSTFQDAAARQFWDLPKALPYKDLQ